MMSHSSILVFIITQCPTDHRCWQATKILLSKEFGKKWSLLISHVELTTFNLCNTMAGVVTLPNHASPPAQPFSGTFRFSTWHRTSATWTGIFSWIVCLSDRISFLPPLSAVPHCLLLRARHWINMSNKPDYTFCSIFQQCPIVDWLPWLIGCIWKAPKLWKFSVSILL